MFRAQRPVSPGDHYPQPPDFGLIDGMGTSAASMIVECASCGAKNRVRPTQEAKTRPVCGRCGSPLPSRSSVPVTVTDSNFESVVGGSPIPVLLDMWAAWCGPCRTIAPTIEALAAELSGRVLVGKIDVDANPRTSSRFGVQGIPTLLVINNGREVDRLVGVQSKEAVLRRLEAYL